MLHNASPLTNKNHNKGGAKALKQSATTADPSPTVPSQANPNPNGSAPHTSATKNRPNLIRVSPAKWRSSPIRDAVFLPIDGTLRAS